VNAERRRRASTTEVLRDRRAVTLEPRSTAYTVGLRLAIQQVEESLRRGVRFELEWEDEDEEAVTA